MPILWIWKCTERLNNLSKASKNIETEFKTGYSGSRVCSLNHHDILLLIVQWLIPAKNILSFFHGWGTKLG